VKRLRDRVEDYLDVLYVVVCVASVVVGLIVFASTQRDSAGKVDHAASGIMHDAQIITLEKDGVRRVYRIKLEPVPDPPIDCRPYEQ